MENAEEYIPSESQTIAAKRSVRLAEKWRKTRDGFGVQAGWWSNGIIEGLMVALVIGVNLLIIYPLMGTEAPITQFSGPVVPLLARGIQKMGLSFTGSVQVLNVLSFITFPVGLYLFVRKITGRKMPAILTILVASLPIGPFAEMRVRNAFFGSETPHIVSLTLLPWMMVAILSFLRFGKLSNLVFASVLMGLVALVSPSGFLSVMVFSAITVFSEMLLGNGRLKMSRFAMIVLFSIGLDSFWYNPPFAYWLFMGPLGGDVRQTIAKIVPVSLFAVPILAAFGFLLFDRKPNLQPLFLALFYSIAFAGIVLAGGSSLVNSRFTAEFGIALAFLVGVLVIKISEFVRLRMKNLNYAPRQALAYGLVGIVFVSVGWGIVWGKDRIYYEDRSVLGLWTGVDKDEIWQMRDKFSASPLAFLGIVISAFTVLGLSGLGVATVVNSKNESHS